MVKVAMFARSLTSSPLVLRRREAASKDAP
jgi:hypothetical protein